MRLKTKLKQLQTATQSFSVGNEWGTGLCTNVLEILPPVVVQAFDLNLIKPVH